MSQLRHCRGNRGRVVKSQASWSPVRRLGSIPSVPMFFCSASMVFAIFLVNCFFAALGFFAALVFFAGPGPHFAIFSETAR